MNGIKLGLILGVISLLAGNVALAQGIDLFNAEVLEDDTLLIQHLNSYHNCCIPITNEVEVVDFTIFVREIEPYLAGCWCNCYFDIEVVVSDLPQGVYSIEYTYDIDENIHNSTWVTEVFSVEVVGQEIPSEPPSFLASHSDCHGGESVSVDDVGWDHIKLFYR